MLANSLLRFRLRFFQGHSYIFPRIYLTQLPSTEKNQDICSNRGFRYFGIEVVRNSLENSH